MKLYDVAVFGATGFTGALVADELLRRHGRQLRIAIAGRSREKLKRSASELQARHPGCPELGIMLVDSRDRRALAELVSASHVVCSTVGPYAKYGEPLLEICAELGTSYCDLSGELPFLRASIERHHERARASRARLVHAAGFDSVPSDLGVYMLHQHFRQQGKQLASAAAFVTLRGLGISGGTLGSILEYLGQLSSRAELRALALDPYALVPARNRRGPDGLEQLGIRYEAAIDQWSGPFIMATVNTRVVRRTNALLDEAYGRDFRYREVAAFGRGPRAIGQALVTSASLLGLLGVGAFASGRSLLARLGPSPGQGPSPARREQASFEYKVVGEGDGLRAIATIRGGDPGYGETAKMIAEVAVALACDGDRLPARYGVLTPVAALEGRLIERLRAAGLGLSIDPGAELARPSHQLA